MLTFTFWSPSGVSVSRVMTSPCVSAHSWPSAYYVEVRRDDEGAVRRIECRRRRISGRRRGRASLPAAGVSRLLRILLRRLNLRLHFIRDRLLHFGRERNLAGIAATAAIVAGDLTAITGIGSSCAGIRGCFCLRGVGRLQVRRNQPIRKPERRSGVNRIRVPVPAPRAIPRSAAPSPAPKLQSGPRAGPHGLIGPA